MIGTFNMLMQASGASLILLQFVTTWTITKMVTHFLPWPGTRSLTFSETPSYKLSLMYSYQTLPI